MTMNKIKEHFSQIMLIFFLAVLSITFLLPFFWTVSTSLRLPKDSFKLPPSFLPTSFNIQNYIEVFTKFPFFKFITNSLIVSISVVLLNLLISTMAAFAFSRINFKYRNALFLFFLAGMMIPGSATLIPTFIIISKMKLVGTIWALIIPASINPLSIFLLRQYMLTIPKSYDEAAYIDGASRFKIYSRIIIPMSGSVIVMTSLLSFLGTWNDFLRPLIYLSKWEQMTLPIGLKVLTGYQNTGSLAVILAGVVVSLIAPVLIYSFGQKYLVQSAALAGLKS